MAMKQVNSDNLAYILGALYGDGHFSKEGKISFSSTDIEFITKVSYLIKKLLNISVNIRRIELSKKNPAWRDSFEFTSRRLYRKLSKFNPNCVIVPKFILNGNKKIKATFLRGLFDAEGDVDAKKVKRRDGRIDVIRHVKCFSNNVELLKYLRLLLKDLNINSNIFRGKKNNFYVCIWSYKDLNTFNKLIGFVIKRKQFLLEETIKSYKEIQTRWKSKDYKKVINLRNITGFGACKIREELLSGGIKIPRSTIESWIYGRTKITENKQEV